jgi:DNA-binding NarL/FixJ family response regulator
MSVEQRKNLLTHRQTEILTLLSEGMSNKEIASTLKLTEGTVKNHVFTIFSKLGVHNRIRAIVKAKEKNII